MNALAWPQTGDGDADLIVVGAGCAGLATAVFAAIAGLKPLVIERTPLIGETTALSAGTLWVPNTHLATGSGDTPEQAARYLDGITGGRGPAALRARFLALGAQAVRCLSDQSEVRLRAFARHPDYRADLPGATTWGRALECLPFDGRRLGADFARFRPPIPEFTVLGGMMVDRTDIAHLLNAARSAASLRHAARLLLRHAADRLRRPRGTRLVMGNALVGRLLLSLQQRGVPVLTGVRAPSPRRARRPRGRRADRPRGRRGDAARAARGRAGRRRLRRPRRAARGTDSARGHLHAARRHGRRRAHRRGAGARRAPRGAGRRRGVLGARVGAPARRWQRGGVPALRARPRQARHRRGRR
jgi:hypothetical protein